MVSSGASIAIATVVSAHGTVLRQPGTVVVVGESGETIGFNPAGPFDGAIRDLAAQALATGQDRLQRLEIEYDAASYIGLSGGASLDVHATRVRAGHPMFGSASTGRVPYAGRGVVNGDAAVSHLADAAVVCLPTARARLPRRAAMLGDVAGGPRVNRVRDRALRRKLRSGCPEPVERRLVRKVHTPHHDLPLPERQQLDRPVTQH